MISKDLTLLVPWVISHGYLIFLIIATIEGPLITIAGGIAAALGYFNIYIIIFLAIVGDIGGDVLYYGLGYFSKNILRSKFFRFLGVSEERVLRLEKLVHSNVRRAVIFAKMFPTIGPFGHIIIGTTRASLKKFVETALMIGVPKTIFYALVGFFSVKAYLNINKTLAHVEYFILILAGITIIFYFFYKRVTNRFVQKIEE